MTERHRARGRIGHLSRLRRQRIYVVGWIMWLTGVVWLMFHYFVKTTDRFGFEIPHPAERWYLMAHALVSFYGLWWFGLLWPTHVKISWNARIRRGSGGVLFGCIAWLTLSGCALYYLGSDTLRAWVAVMHWVVGLGALVAFFVHLLTRTKHAS